jgi:hypothetical protein
LKQSFKNPLREVWRDGRLRSTRLKPEKNGRPTVAQFCDAPPYGDGALRETPRYWRRSRQIHQ